MTKWLQFREAMLGAGTPDCSLTDDELEAVSNYELEPDDIDVAGMAKELLRRRGAK